MLSVMFTEKRWVEDLVKENSKGADKRKALRNFDKSYIESLRPMEYDLITIRLLFSSQAEAVQHRGTRFHCVQ